MDTAAEPWRRAGFGYRRRSFPIHREPARVMTVEVMLSDNDIDHAAHLFGDSLHELPGDQ